MFIKNLVFYSCLLVLSGCIYNDEPMPKIVQRPTFDKPAVTRPPTAAIRRNDVDKNIPSDWLPPSYLEKRWTAVVIHHSGTSYGNTAIFDKWHKEGKHWQGVGYDFVIGNGTDSTDGQVEVTFRWREQKTGAHCGGTAGNWANKDAIGICLVGNFNKTLPTVRQMRSVVKLVRFLQNRYGIAKSRIYGHNTTPGARVTDCPGRNFPMAWLKSILSK